MNNLTEIVEAYKEQNNLQESLLGFCHTTKLTAYKDHIIKNKELKALSQCAYHNSEYLIFFFYGKAPYVPKEHQGSCFDPKNLPVTIIFDKELFKNKIRRFCCTDSGALFSGIFEEEDSDTDIKELDDFLFDSPLIQDLIAATEALYTKNENYINNQYDPQFSINEHPKSKFLKFLKNLYDQQTNELTSFGEQAFTFELQILERIDLNPEALIIPQSLMCVVSHYGPKQLSKDFPGVSLVPYKYTAGDEIMKSYMLMREKVDEYFKLKFKRTA